MRPTEDAFAQELDNGMTSFGPALYLRIQRYDGDQMTWPEVCEVFNELHPGRWAVQFFPPREEILDEANIYHLYVLEYEPEGVNIR